MGSSEVIAHGNLIEDVTVDSHVFEFDSILHYNIYDNTFSQIDISSLAID